MPKTLDEIKKYVGPFSGPQMDQIFYEILNYTSERFAKGTAGGVPVAAGTPGYNDNSLFYKNQAAAQVSLAQAAAAAAANSAQRAESAVPAGTDAAVLWTTDQSAELTADDKAVARKNIMAGSSNKNLLDNPWFTVNQRGLSRYTGPGYTVDRWRTGATGATIDIDENGVTLSPDASFGFQQKLTTELVTALVGKTVTYSILLQNGTLRTLTFTWPNSPNVGVGVISGIGTLFVGTTLGISFVHPSTLSIRAIKLELGSVSTLANDTAPNYAEELAKCQRYFTVITASNNWHPMGFGLATNGTTAYISLPIPVSMRAGTITVTVPNITNLNLTGGGSINIALTSIAFRAISENAVSLTITTSGLTQGESYVLYSKAASTTIQISADL